MFGAFGADVEFQAFAFVVEVPWYGDADESALSPIFNIFFLLQRDRIYYIIPPDAMKKKQRDQADHERNREKRLSQMAERYARLQDAGLCVQCGEAKAAHSVSRCEVCLESMRVRMMSKRPKKTK